MKKCDYCGRDNREGAVFCDECGTRIKDRQQAVARQLTASEKKRGWVAVAIAFFSIAAGSALAWSSSQRLNTIAGYVTTIGGMWAVLTLIELRKAKAGTEDDTKSQS